jgi:predicted metal-dependent peptidase
MAKHEAAEKRMQKARTHLTFHHPFYGTLALHLRMIEVDDPSWCDTMATDGRSLCYWPAFVMKLSEQEVEGVIAHEVTHCAYRHMMRERGRNHNIWNIACDFVINPDLIATGHKLPKGALLDKAYAGMSAEQVYEILMKKIKPDQIPKLGACGTGFFDLPKGGEKGGLDKRELEALEHEWESIVRTAIGVARAAGIGKLPGHLEAMFTDLNKPKVDWRSLLRQFIDAATSKDHSWKRPNRRFSHQGLYLPGYISESLSHLVMAIDTSGSVSDEMLKAFLSEVAGALSTGIVEKLTVIYADTKVQKVEVYEPGMAVTPKATGRGGTDFADTFRWIIEKAPDASCVIYLTDMDTGSWGQDPGCPVLWAAYTTEAALERYTPPFGNKLFVESPY